MECSRNNAVAEVRAARKRSDYRLAEFNRRQRIRIQDFSTWIVSKEDLILSKLCWAKDSHRSCSFAMRRILCSPAPTVATSNVGRMSLGWPTCGRKSRVNDTSPEIAELVRQRLMSRSGEERFVMGVRMFEAARDMVRQRLPALSAGLVGPRLHRQERLSVSHHRRAD